MRGCPQRIAAELWLAVEFEGDYRSGSTGDRHGYVQRAGGQVPAGYPLGPAHITQHAASARTHGATGHPTNGPGPGTRPLDGPAAGPRGAGPVITFEFDGQPQLGGYSLWTAAQAAVGVKLQKSADGTDWQDVSGSQLSTGAGRGRHQRTLGVGSTLSASSHGRGG